MSFYEIKILGLQIKGEVESGGLGGRLYAEAIAISNTTKTIKHCRSRISSRFCQPRSSQLSLQTFYGDYP